MLFASTGIDTVSGVRHYHASMGNDIVRIHLPDVPSGHDHSFVQYITILFHMDVAGDDGAGAKKRRLQEAQMIPGVDGKLQFGFPNSIITTIRYADVLTLVSTTGGMGINVFAANGTFDPDITNVGHQPMYRDTYASIYDQYVVLGSRITARFGARGAVNWLIGIVGDDDSSISSTASTKMEQNNSHYEMLGGMGSQPKTITMTFDPLSKFGVDAKDDGSSQTAIGSNPTELWCFGVYAHTLDASTATLDLLVDIEYTVKFSELVTPTQS